MLSFVMQVALNVNKCVRGSLSLHSVGEAKRALELSSGAHGSMMADSRYIVVWLLKVSLAGGSCARRMKVSLCEPRH